MFSAIEVGIPWSDPVADGPVIELAGQRSLAKDVTLTAIIKKLQEQKTQVPFGYHDLHQPSLSIWYRSLC